MGIFTNKLSYEEFNEIWDIVENHGNTVNGVGIKIKEIRDTKWIDFCFEGERFFNEIGSLRLKRFGWGVVVHNEAFDNERQFNKFVRKVYIKLKEKYKDEIMREKQKTKETHNYCEKQRQKLITNLKKLKWIDDDWWKND